ncbi:hypothetical protein Acr_27g0003490 [Actinidia rufa]|uniref:Uncharacterized protein n=1 Tax=Actinidia rufa TaxID=165716 RepID=A0A7J0H687_9ERIC|nr:hypothetical protein Acr_27g0003490 [Actinidia rufa]
MSRRLFGNGYSNKVSGVVAISKANQKKGGVDFAVLQDHPAAIEYAETMVEQRQTLRNNLKKDLKKELSFGGSGLLLG